jgi:hypothetical protein
MQLGQANGANLQMEIIPKPMLLLQMAFLELLP